MTTPFNEIRRSEPDNPRVAAKAAVMKRRETVMALTARGLSERQIAAIIGASRSTVWADKQFAKAVDRE